jgi:hypothetical protein
MYHRRSSLHQEYSRCFTQFRRKTELDADKSCFQPDAIIHRNPVLALPTLED